MRIEIDGSPIEKPQYAKSLNDGQFSEYVVNAGDYVTGCWQGGNLHEPDMAMLQKIRKDPELENYKLNIIKRGPESSHSFHNSIILTADLADKLAKKKELLELVPTKKFTVSKTPYPLRRRKPDEKLESFRSVGTFLKEGAIVFKGDVDEINAVDGGLVYVDGDANLVDQNRSGIIYVRGDIYNLKDTDKEIVVVGGKIHNFSQERNSKGGLGLEVTPSPFIFANHAIKNEKENEFRRYQGRKDKEDLTIDIPPSAFVIAADKLRDWMPEETKRKALKLCRERIGVYFEDLRKMVLGIRDPETMARFAEQNLYGFLTGKVEGRYSGSSSRHSSDD
jgi:hypothetical protein